MAKMVIDITRDEAFDFFKETTQLDVKPAHFQSFVGADGVRVDFSDYSHGNPTGHVEMNVYGLDGGAMCVRLGLMGDRLHGGMSLSAQQRRAGDEYGQATDIPLLHAFDAVRSIAPQLVKYEHKPLVVALYGYAS